MTVAESLTGGRTAALLAETPGASRYLLGGVVVYSEALKRQLLGVPADLLAERGAVSLEVAESMAAQARSRLAATTRSPVPAWPDPRATARTRWGRS